MFIFFVSTTFQNPKSEIRSRAGMTGARKQAAMDVPVTQPKRIIVALGGMSSASTAEHETRAVA